MELLLPFEVSPSPLKITYTDKILFIGSCFTEEIGKRMKDLKFNLFLNPNGILYDPISISSALNAYMDNIFSSWMNCGIAGTIIQFFQVLIKKKFYKI